MYTFGWVNVTREIEKEMYQVTNDELICPMREDPLHLIPIEQRNEFLAKLMSGGPQSHYTLQIEGDLCPSCRQMYRDLTRRYKGDWTKVIEHVRVHRLALSEKDRIGIGTFQPKDEKNQDSTELTGDINYRKIAIYGSDSDARAFNFDGEFNVANRGIIEFIEVLKLEVAFLYDLLARARNIRSNRRSSPRPTLMKSSSVIPTSPNTGSFKTTSSWKRCVIAR
jgi:serine protein kinase